MSMTTIQEPRRFDLAFYVPPDAPNLGEYLKGLQDLGINRIGTNGLVGWRDAALIQRIGRTIQEYSMQVVSVHSTIGLRWPEDGRIEQTLADNRTIVDQAASWGSRSSVWHWNWFRGGKDGNYAELAVMDSLPTERIEELMAEVLPATCDYAVQRGVWINLENLPLVRWGRDSFRLIQFIRRLNLPGLGLILDSGHAHANGQDVAQVIRQAGSLLRDMHFHDNVGPQGFNFTRNATENDMAVYDLHAICGLGTINWINVIRSLWDVGFPGPVVLEGPHIKGHPDESLQQWQRCVELNICMWRAMEEAAWFWPTEGAMSKESSRKDVQP